MRTYEYDVGSDEESAAIAGRPSAAPAPAGWCVDAGGADPAAVPEATRRPGRPRSERAEQAILDAAIEAVGENGIDGVSCEDVAARAGVGKATLYRRWTGKEDLLIAAFASMKRRLPPRRVCRKLAIASGVFSRSTARFR